MKIKNRPVLCPHCGCQSAYYEIDRLAGLRENSRQNSPQQEWDSLLKNNKKKAFCLMCYKTIIPSMLDDQE
ncbi:hypothetical protein SMQC19_46500 (plasmid) [Serratia marcescens]|nr:hypothetical protein SMQC19_46500 [Serratia marcescens]